MQQHIENINKFGLPVVVLTILFLFFFFFFFFNKLFYFDFFFQIKQVCINRFASDTDEELKIVIKVYLF